ncbi:Metallo-dependent phosphatase-like protein [Dendryphion nanum]|uniref:Metallo-dependent phosphatase-like protein n=1 Tax=Dendryphion nanum TaxID=256645 RepID=A0A9P9DDA3_9PLEO|nr:Metallo-dependent phosphatase-like protein [Dendryphion nanum]
MTTNATPTIKTRILIISDTHNASLYPSSTSSSSSTNAFPPPFRTPLPTADVLLHCGDLTMVGHLHEYEQTLSMLRSIDAPLKLVIAGNHDISLDSEFYARRGQSMQRLRSPDPDLPRRARELWTGQRAREAGIVYLEEGVYEFGLGNGARLRVYASPYQPEFCDWAFPYWRHQDRFNPVHQSTPESVSIVENPVPDFPSIDVLMTHGPPLGIRDATTSGENVGCEHLLRAARRCRPRLHCFGHIHEAWGAERVRWKEGDGDEGGGREKWEDYVERKEEVAVDETKMKEDGAVFIDITKEGGNEVVFGTETMMVNASIMTHSYTPHQGPWVVDLDLEKSVD